MWTGSFFNCSERVNNKKCTTEPLLDEERMVQYGFSKEDIAKFKNRCPFTKSTQRTGERPPSWLWAFGDFHREEIPTENMSEKAKLSKEEVLKFKHIHRCPLKKSSQAPGEQLQDGSNTQAPKETWAFCNRNKMEHKEEKMAQERGPRCFWKNNKSTGSGDQNINMPSENAPWAHAWGDYYRMKYLKEEKMAHRHCCCKDNTSHRCSFKKNSQEKSEDPDSVVGMANGVAVWFFPRKQ